MEPSRLVPEELRTSIVALSNYQYQSCGRRSCSRSLTAGYGTEGEPKGRQANSQPNRLPVAIVGLDGLFCGFLDPLFDPFANRHQRRWTIAGRFIQLDDRNIGSTDL